MRISDWSSDVCSSDLARVAAEITCGVDRALDLNHAVALVPGETDGKAQFVVAVMAPNAARIAALARFVPTLDEVMVHKSEEHTSELQSLMRISYAVFCLKKKKKTLIHSVPQNTH